MQSIGGRGVGRLDCMGLAKFCRGEEGGVNGPPWGPRNKLCLSLFFGGRGLCKKQNLMSPVACLGNPLFGRPGRGVLFPPPCPPISPTLCFSQEFASSGGRGRRKEGGKFPWKIEAGLEHSFMFGKSVFYNANLEFPDRNFFGRTILYLPKYIQANMGNTLA